MVYTLNLLRAKKSCLEEMIILNKVKPVAGPLKLNATLFPLHLTQNSVSVFCVYNNNAIILKRFKNGKLPAKQWTKREMQNTDE